jgi:hypothetical protein
MISVKDVSRLDYLRYRPFLVVELFIGPAAGVRTNKKGWNKNIDNVNITELPSVVNRISDKIMRRATIIIDILQNKIVKNREAGDHDDEVLEFYKQKYSDTITSVKRSWLMDY